MNKLFKFLLPVTLLLAVPAALATDEIANQTGLKCTACHDKAGSRLLTDQGKYFETKRSLDGFDQISTAFGRCTSCHVRKPGSNKLTKKGKRFAEVVGSMGELREWLDDRHPMLSREDARKLRDKDAGPSISLAPSH